MQASDDPISKPFYTAANHTHTTGDFLTEKYNVLIIVERAFQGEGKDVLTQEHIKSLLKDYKYGGVVGPLPYGDEGGSQSAFAIKMDDPEEFKRAKRELGCDEYDKPGDKYPEDQRKIKFFYNDLDKTFVAAKWKKGERWPQPQFMDFPQNDALVNEYYTSLAEHRKHSKRGPQQL